MVEGFYDHANIYKKVKTLKDEHKVYFPRGTKQKDIIKELDKWMKETYRYHKPIKKKDHDPLIEKTYKFKALEIRPRTKPKITVC